MSTVIAVVVTYRQGDVSQLLSELNEQCEGVIVVDNGSEEQTLCELRTCCRRLGAQLLEIGANIGIAAAQNWGIALARHAGADYVLLSDHDSLPAPDMVAKLVTAIGEDPRIAAVGPLPAEDRKGADELVYVDRGWGPKRATKEELAASRIEVAFLIASGCLIKLQAIDAVGGMREDLFIDHVDLEWGCRARRDGWRLLAVPAARLTHTLGDDVVEIPHRAQPVHVHAPIRNYYLVRNTLVLVRGTVLPWRWRVRYVYWLAKYVAFNGLLADRRPQRRRLIVRGLHDGLTGRMGRRDI